MARASANLVQEIARTESVIRTEHAVKDAFWDTLETHVRKNASQLAMGRAMDTQLERTMVSAQLACQVSMAGSARRNAIRRAELARSTEVYSIKLGEMMTVRHVQMMSLQC